LGSIQSIDLIKYSDNDQRGEYIWFWVNKDKSIISPSFKSEEEAHNYIKQIIEENDNKELSENQ